MAKRKSKKSPEKKTTRSSVSRKKKAGGARKGRSSTRKPASAAVEAGQITTRVSSPKTAKPEVIITLTHDQIARKAYEIWVSKGRPLGQDEQNWNEAVAQLKGMDR